MNDLALSENPKLEKLVKRFREEGYTIEIRPLGPKPGPGCMGDGTVILNNYYLRGLSEDFTENRMIIVLFHELGHVKYENEVPIEQQTDADSEYRAFENSIEEAIRMAEAGDHLPLQEAIFWLEWRKSSGGALPHYQNALDLLIASELWKRANEIVEISQ